MDRKIGTDAGAKVSTESEAGFVCFCFGVTRAEIFSHFKETDATYDTLVKKTRVGTKCTACLLDLDLIVDEASGERAARQITTDDKPDARGDGLFKVPVDQCNSGFFINRGGIATIIRFANHGPIFENLPHATGFRYSLQLVTDLGKRSVLRRGRLEIDAEVTLDLSEFPGMPEQGWFILSFYPDREGLMGSVRPQIALRGPHWVTCYHPQYHHYACRSRSIPVQKVAGRFSTEVHMINASRAHTNVVFRAQSVQSPYRAEYRCQLGGYHASFESLDNAFPDAPDHEVLSVNVLSDNPIRKHVLNYLGDGAVSVDHFPDFK